jgi:hypothetical protein
MDSFMPGWEAFRLRAASAAVVGRRLAKAEMFLFADVSHRVLIILKIIDSARDWDGFGRHYYLKNGNLISHFAI